MIPTVVFAFTAGAVSTVNPCGFALLPAWFARQLAGRAGDGPAQRFLRAGASSAMATIGYVIIFVAAALILGSGASWLGPFLPYAGVAIGSMLVIWGMAALLGISLAPARFAATCRRASERYGAFGFGLSYGFVSLSCTLPIFMAVAGVSFLESNVLAVQNIAFFLLGSGAILALISVVAAMLGVGVFQMVGRHHATLRRISGVLTLLAGAYVILYWGQVIFGDAPWMRAILDTGSYWAAMLNQFLSERNGPLVALVSLLAIAGLSLVIWLRRPDQG